MLHIGGVDMKKLFACLLCFLTCLTFSGCSLLFHYQYDAVDNFYFGYSEILKEAFVASYHWDETDAAKNIVIPEKYNGVKVTALGGYTGRGAPCDFCVLPPKSYEDSFGVNQWAVSGMYEHIESVDTIYLNFDLHISKNIEQIKAHALDLFYEGTYFDGKTYHTKVIVVMLFRVTCDEDNKTFYAEEGKLYYRKNNELVSDILYFDHEFKKE